MMTLKETWQYRKPQIKLLSPLRRRKSGSIYYVHVATLYSYFISCALIKVCNNHLESMGTHDVAHLGLDTSVALYNSIVTFCCCQYCSALCRWIAYRLRYLLRYNKLNALNHGSCHCAVQTH